MRVRLVLKAALVALLGLVLAGCFKLDGDLTVTSDDQVDGTFVFAVNERLLAVTGQSKDALTDEILRGVEADKPAQGTISAEPYDDGTFVGATLTFEGVPLDEFSTPTTGGQEGQLRITKEGDLYRVSGELDLTTQALQGDTAGDIDFGALTELLQGNEPEISIRISFPGEIVSTNGTVDGCSVSWAPALGQNTSLDATAKSSGGCSGQGIRWWAWILIGIGVLVLIGAIFAIVRNLRRDKPKALPPGSTPTAAATTAATDDLPPESTPLMAPPAPGSTPSAPLTPPPPASEPPASPTPPTTAAPPAPPPPTTPPTTPAAEPPAAAPPTQPPAATPPAEPPTTEQFPPPPPTSGLPPPPPSSS